MNAGSRFLSAVSAVALTAGFVAGAGAINLITPVSANAAVIRHISVNGAQRVGAETVKANLTIVPGKSFDPAEIDRSIKRLYATGYFADVRITVSGGTLVVSVKENNLVNQVVFNGNRKIKDDKLATIVKTHALGPFSQALIESDIQSIRDAYAAIGRSDVKVTTQTVPVGDGMVNLAFVINEGDRTKIEDITFSGNTHYSSFRLKAVISTKESGLFSFVTRRDIYSEDKLRADQEALRQFYYNHGYADFRVISSDATLNPATNKYTINFVVDEGDRYKFGPISVESSVEGVKPEDLKKLVDSSEGSTYRAKDVQDSISAISKRLATAGYPFARVTPRGNRDMSGKTIGVDYVVDQGDHAYVERIEIRGNTTTRDYVIRREFDISEGDAFNQEMLAEAKRRLDALGYFSSVNITTQPGSSPDRVIIVVDVTDQSTGSFGIGAGYATGGEGFIVEASIEEKNFLGRGQYIKVSASGGALTRNYTISFTEPYFLGYRLAAGFDLFKSISNIYDNYSYADQGFTLRVTAPITNDLSTTFAYNYKELRYTSDAYHLLSAPYRALVDGTPWLVSSVSQSFNYNTLDTMVLPHEGILANFTQEYAGLGGSSNYYKLTAKARTYYTISDDMDLIGSLSGGAGYMLPVGGNHLNVFDQFTLGSDDIRGFYDNGLGPRMGPNTGDYLGGTTYFTTSAEMSFPLPGIPQDSGFRGAVFMDAATVYGNDVPITKGHVVGNAMDWRASAGASLIWISPFGPLRLDYAIPFLKQPYDVEQRLKFGIQTSF